MSVPSTPGLGGSGMRPSSFQPVSQGQQPPTPLTSQRNSGFVSVRQQLQQYNSQHQQQQQQQPSLPQSQVQPQSYFAPEVQQSQAPLSAGPYAVNPQSQGNASQASPPQQSQPYAQPSWQGSSGVVVERRSTSQPRPASRYSQQEPTTPPLNPVSGGSPPQYPHQQQPSQHSAPQTFPSQQMPQQLSQQQLSQQQSQQPKSIMQTNQISSVVHNSSGLGSLLEHIEGTGPPGLVQLNCDTLHAAITALLRNAKEQGAALGVLQSGLHGIVDSVGGLPDEATFRDMYSRIDETLPRLESQIHHSVQQQVADVQARLARAEADSATIARQQQVIDALERRVSDAERACAQNEQAASQAEALQRRFDQLEARLDHKINSDIQRTPSRGPLSPPLKDSIQDMLVTCQDLATKQADTVSVMAQAFQRVESLEEAMASVQDVVSRLCDNQHLAQALYTVFEAPFDLQPHLNTPNDRLQLLLSLPVFQYFLGQLNQLNQLSQLNQTGAPPPETPADAAAAGTPHTPHRSATMEGEPPHGVVGVEELRVEALVPRGMDRSALEAADKLVAALTQAMSDRRETGQQQMARIPSGRPSPRAREFRSLSPRTSPQRIMTAAPQQGASVRSGSSEDPEASLLGIEVVDGDSEGVVVTRIYPNSPSSVGGLRAGDRIISFNGANITTRANFLRALARTRQSQLVPIIFVPQAGTTPVATHLVIGGLGAS